MLIVQYNILISFVYIKCRLEFYKTKHLQLASYGCSKSTCAASVLFWPSSEKSVPHTSASVFCRTFHIEAAFVDICLLPFCSPVFVLFLVERNQEWVLLVILQDGSFDFRAVVGLSRLLVHISQCLIFLHSLQHSLMLASLVYSLN